MRRAQTRTSTFIAVLFLLAGLAGACVDEVGAPPSSVPPSRGKADDLTASSCQGASASMEYVKVCGPDAAGATTCKCISKLVMGTDHLGNLWEQTGFPEAGNQTPSWQRKSHAAQMLDDAVAKGINMFDTSPIYVDGIENTLGAWLQQRKQQDPGLKLYTLTKGGFPVDKGPGTYDSRLHGSKKEIIKNIADELQWSYPNLHGQIDFYLMHRDDIRFVDYADRTFADEYGAPRTQTPVQTILAALSDTTVYSDIPLLGGKSIRSHYTWIGVSNWTTSRVNAALQAAKSDASLLAPMINSPYFSLFEMSGTYTIHSGGVEVTHTEMMNSSFQKGVLIMPYSPLGGFPIIDRGTAAQAGHDAWQNAKAVAKGLDNNKDRYWGNVYEALFTPENEQRFERVYAISKAFKLDGKAYTIDQWLNAYVLAHPRTDLLAVGPIKKVHLERTTAALALARALRKRTDILEWLHSGKLADLATLPPLADQQERTVILMYGVTQPGQDMYLRGGIDHGYAKSSLGRSCTAENKLCAVPITHLSVVNNSEIVNDHFLDWYGAEPGQGAAQGSPAMWTTNAWPAEWGPKKTVAVDGYGETPLNTYGHHYWLLDVKMDCSRTVNGWFELKSYISNGPGWEGSINQSGGPYGSWNHFARCGKINVFRRGQDAPVEIKEFPAQ